MRVSGMAALAAVAVCALGLGAGCGDDDEAESGAAPAAGQTAQATTEAAVEKPAGTPIKIGITADMTGPLSSSNSAFGRGLNVWVKAINAKGGIDGHPVVADLRDTKSDVTQMVSSAKELLASDIVAFVPGSSQGLPVTKLISASDIPAVGGLAVDPLWATNPNVFASGTTPDALGAAIATLGVQALGDGAAAADLYCAEAPACKDGVGLFKAGVAKAGARLTYTAAISSTAPDYTAQCLAAKEKDVKFVWISAIPALVERVAKDCAKNGYKPVYVNPFYSSSYEKVPELEGMQVASSQALHTSAAAKAFRDAAATYDAGMLEKLSSPSAAMSAWASGELIAAAVKASGASGDITAADVRKGLYALDGETLGGLAPPLRFVKGKPASQPCFFGAVLQGGKLVQKDEDAICPS